MSRIALIAVGAVVVSGAVAFLLFKREPAAVPHPDVSAEPTPVDFQAPRRGGLENDATPIRSRSFAEETDQSLKLKRSRAQSSVLDTASRLLAEKTPPEWSQKELGDEALRALRAELDTFVLRERQIQEDCRDVGVKRLKEVYDAGGWQVWEERKITIPYPGKPRETITRNASPYDDKVEDEIISETGANGPDGLLQNRVVRLRPETDETWAAAVADRRAKISDLRRQVRETVDRFFSR